MSLLPKEDYNGTYEIPFERFYDKGVRGVIFDIDNTLVLHDAPADNRSRELFNRLKNIGFKTCIVSNNGLERVKCFAEDVGSLYVENAGKPGTEGYRKALEAMCLDRESVIAVGDQLFTDIWGANNSGIYSVLVKPIGPEKYFHIKLKRLLEKPVLSSYYRKRK
ncbi:MAG: YqeG family HAD IIIA-type phosphatase [Lachnospiraceae bacterium]|nr:YqeG family HAD IIIA-type phosphatase [Lachnospiraceae bacterium]